MGDVELHLRVPHYSSIGTIQSLGAQPEKAPPDKRPRGLVCPCWDGLGRNIPNLTKQNITKKRQVKACNSVQGYSFPKEKSMS